MSEITDKQSGALSLGFVWVGSTTSGYHVGLICGTISMQLPAISHDAARNLVESFIAAGYSRV